MKVLWIILGVISILAGVLALANPMAATLAAEQIAGWGFLIVGVLQIFLAFRAEGWGARIWAILVALAFILLGIALLGGVGMRLAPRLGHLNLVPPQADALEGAILFAQSEAYPCLHP